MNTIDRRNELISILIVRHRTTLHELANELGVTPRTIQNDIQALSLDYPIYTKQGGDGGVFITDGYNPHRNILTAKELETLTNLYKKEQGESKDVLFGILKKYGPNRLAL